jgi:hypothetical protein
MYVWHMHNMYKAMAMDMGLTRMVMKMVMVMQQQPYAHVIAIAAAIVVGSMYFVMMETSISMESSCSYASTPMTDYLAFLWGVTIVCFGWKVYDNPILTVLGASVIVEHLWQLKNKGNGISSLRKQP